MSNNILSVHSRLNSVLAIDNLQFGVVIILPMSFDNGNTFIIIHGNGGEGLTASNIVLEAVA